MKQKDMCRIACAAAALVVCLTACGKNSASDGTTSNGTMSGSSSTSNDTSYDSQQMAWRTGVGMYVKSSEAERAVTLNTAAAAVLLDGDGRIVQVTVDELEADFSADGSGAVTVPNSYQTKREQRDSYSAPMATVSSIGKGWSEQMDAFAAYLVGMTESEVAALTLDVNGYPTDTDLLSSCTIKVDGYKEAVLRACADAEAIGASQGDRLELGMQGTTASGTTNATDDADGSAGIVVTAAALTVDENERVTSAVCDEIEPSLTIVSDGEIRMPTQPQSKREQGDNYGMRAASALGKEWYEQSEGFCDYVKGKTATEIASLSTNEADLAALCTIDATPLQQAVLKAVNAEQTVTQS